MQNWTKQVDLNQSEGLFAGIFCETLGNEYEQGPDAGYMIFPDLAMEGIDATGLPSPRGRRAEDRGPRAYLACLDDLLPDVWTYFTSHSLNTPERGIRPCRRRPAKARACPHVACPQKCRENRVMPRAFRLFI